MKEGCNGEFDLDRCKACKVDVDSCPLAAEGDGSLAPVALQGLTEADLDTLLAQVDIGGNSIPTPGLPPLDVQSIVAAANNLLRQARQEVDADVLYTGPDSEIVQQVSAELDESSQAPSKPGLN